jgi:putative ABC transport system permease protein
MADPGKQLDTVLVSESFSLRFDTGPGSSIELATSRGPARLQVAGVYYDYASNQGTVMMDATTYRHLYGDSDPDPAPQHLSIYLKREADPQQVRERLLGSVGNDEQLYCVTNREVRDEAMRIFESTFTVTYALQLIAIIVAGLGVASTLITLIYQRQRDLGLLSLVGATFRQTRRVILCEAVLLGGVSQLIGVSIGVVLAAVLIYVINVQSFGWTIQFRLPWMFLATSTLFVLMASALFGLYPAVRAASADPLQTVREQ